MKLVPLLVDDPGEFGYVDGQTFYNEKLAYTILEHAARMTDEGYEITFEEPDDFDYSVLWSRQTSTIYALMDALNEVDAEGDVKSFYNALVLELTELTNLSSSRDNYNLRLGSITTAVRSMNFWGTPSQESAVNEELLQAIQDLKYNDQVIEIPATPRPFKIHLIGKTIQQ